MKKIWLHKVTILSFLKFPSKFSSTLTELCDLCRIVITFSTEPRLRHSRYPHEGKLFLKRKEWYALGTNWTSTSLAEWASPHKFNGLLTSSQLVVDFFSGLSVSILAIVDLCSETAGREMAQAWFETDLWLFIDCWDAWWPLAMTQPTADLLHFLRSSFFFNLFPLFSKSILHISNKTRQNIKTGTDAPAAKPPLQQRLGRSRKPLTYGLPPRWRPDALVLNPKYLQ